MAPAIEKKEHNIMIEPQPSTFFSSVPGKPPKFISPNSAFSSHYLSNHLKTISGGEITSSRNFVGGGGFPPHPERSLRLWFSENLGHKHDDDVGRFVDVWAIQVGSTFAFSRRFNKRSRDFHKK